ncbi:hypothetical protein ACFWIO_19170 [Streptomyces diastatochromogenes]|uniref:hypothetical protein n=1 Tax=Streptomyces diastatochromogenes TaxID=42236 RepID=UPI0036624E8D
MPAKRTPARRATPAKRRRTSARKHPARRVKIPRSGPIHARLGSWLVLRVVVPMVDTHSDTVRSRKDAAILRETHKGCPTCHGNGQIFTKGKDGSFTGSKPCPAKPTTTKVSKWTVYKASRFGADRTTGLVGWSCPCGKKEKPRYRDAREATKALRTHERQKHGGKTVGGAWYAQAANVPTQPAKQQQAPQTKVVTNSGLTDQQWVKQNKPMAPAKAITKGLCWQCAGNGKLYSAFGGQQLIVVCSECRGNGKAPKQAA